MPLKRRYELTLKMGADSMDEMIVALKNYALELRLYHSELLTSQHSVSGSPSVGYSSDIEFNPDVTHESYHAEIQAFLAQSEKAQ